MTPIPNALEGYELVEDPTLLQQVGVQQVKRSFSERFFSLPWCPWQVAREEPVYGPSDDFVVTETSVIGHPERIQALREYLGAP